MEFERNRLRTFATYPSDATVSALKLANSGFICSTNGKEVICSLCGWHTAHFRMTFDEILRNHASLSSKCPMIQGNAYETVNWIKVNDFKTCINNSNLNENKQIGTILNLNQNGKKEKVSKTIHNEARSSLLRGEASINMGIEHQITSEGGEERRGLTDTSGESQAASQNIPTTAPNESFSSDQYPELTNHAWVSPLATREVLHPQDMPRSLNLRNQADSANTSNELVEMRPDLSYPNLGIIIKKFKQPKNVPRSERPKTFVTCPKEYRLLPEELIKSGDRNTVETKRSNAKEEARHSENDIEDSAKLTKEVLETLQKENNELREKSLCKICWDKNLEILLIPCGHLLSCTECAASLKLCPICRNDIQEKIQVILS